MTANPGPPIELPSFAHRRVVITGGTGGIGLRAAELLAAAGADVVIGARSAEKATSVVASIRDVTTAGAVSFGLLDLADQGSIADFAAAQLEDGTPIDLLINCAGVMAIPKRELTVDGFERHIGTNHLGHFALTGRLLPLLGEAGPARVVTVSAQAARTAQIDLDDLMLERSYAPMRAYARSKLANVMFAIELNEHVGAKPVLSLAIHPGTAETGIQQYQQSAIANWVARRIMHTIGQPLDRVADTILFAATSGAATAQSFIAPTGLFELGGAPGLVKLPQRAEDGAARQALWAESAQLTGVSF